MKNSPAKDFKAMDREKWTQFGNAFTEEMKKQSEIHEMDDNAHIDACLTRMNTCLQKAIEVNVPAKKRLSSIKRAPSERTRALYEARAHKFSSISAQGGKVTKQLRKRWNRKICKANLDDYNEWLKKWQKEWKKQTKLGTQRRYSALSS